MSQEQFKAELEDQQNFLRAAMNKIADHLSDYEHIVARLCP